MKKVLFAFFLFFTTQLINASTYYWNPQMGGVDWHDLNNWVTTSGGSAIVGSVPTINDDVIVDSNSSDVLILIGDSAHCHTISFIGPFASAPEIGSAPGIMFVSGSFYGVDDLNISAVISFNSNTSGNMIDINNPLAFMDPLFFNLYISFDGTGEWTLGDNVRSYTFIVNSGTLNTNNMAIETSNMQVWGNSPRSVDFGTSQVTCFDNGGFGVYGSNYTVDVDSMVIELKSGFGIAGGFIGGSNLHFPLIVIDSNYAVLSIDGDDCEIDRLISRSAVNYFPLNGVIHRAEFTGGGLLSDVGVLGKYVHYDSLILSADDIYYGGGMPSYYFDNDSLFVNDFMEVNSSITDTIGLMEYNGGSANILSLPNDSLCFNYMKLHNVNAVGSGYYYAGINSLNLGGNSGWIFSNCPSLSVGEVSIDQTQNEIQVFPNPNDGNFNVAFNSIQKSNYTLEIHNALGQVVYREVLNDFTGNYTKKLRVVEFGQGVYTITLTNSENETVKKIIVY